MKNKKSLIAIIAVLLITAVGVTFAYFQSTGEFENFFQTATYRLVTTEVFESPDNWKPGEEIPKTITTTNEGTIEAAVRMSYTERWYDKNDNDITESIEAGSAIINFDTVDDWIKEGRYYYYRYILGPNEETTSFIKSVTLKEELGNVTCTENGLQRVCEASSPALGAKYVLTITKDTVEYDKYQEAWNTNVNILINRPANEITIVSGQKGALQPGDVIGIGETEDFYVLSSDNSENGKTIAIAKYSLLVGELSGNIYRDVDITELPGYGLQDVDVAGYGVHSSVEFKGSIGRAECDDEALAYADRLKSMGAPNSTTCRLLTYDEAVNYENVTSGNVSVIHNGVPYWLDTYGSPGKAWTVGRTLYEGLIDDAACYTFRPVIEVLTSRIG